MAEQKFFTGTELLEKELIEIPSLLEPILPKVGLAAVTGSSDTGKSSFLRHLAMNIVLGKDDFIGFKLNALHKSVIYVATEDDEDATAVLLKKTFDNLFEYENYYGLRFLFETENLLRNLDAELTERPADCVIIDTYSDIFTGSMNQSNEVRNFLNDYKELAQRHKCLLLFLHHTGKRTDGLAPSKDNTLGSQGFEAKMRVLIEIRKDYTDPEYRHICIVKGNYLPEEYKNQSFVLVFNNFLYTKTGRREDFSQLSKPESCSSRRKLIQPFIDKAFELKKSGLSQQKIADEITQMGHKVGKSTVGNWLKNINMN